MDSEEDKDRTDRRDAREANGPETGREGQGKATHDAQVSSMSPEGACLQQEKRGIRRRVFVMWLVLFFVCLFVCLFFAARGSRVDGRGVYRFSII